MASQRRDKDALDRIAILLNKNEWQVEDLEIIAELVRDTRREVSGPTKTRRIDY